MISAWWFLGAYLLVAVMVFVGLVRTLEPLDGVEWLSTLMAGLFWPIFFVIVVVG